MSLKETNMAYQELTESMIHDALSVAHESPRKRHAVVLHEQGAYFNEVFNFICYDSYMQPHLHPGPEKIEICLLYTSDAADE